jgi:2-methylcitrate dehydratase PrpD
MASDEAPSGSDFVEDFARFAVDLTIDRIPHAVTEAALLNVYDTLACSIAGRTAPGVVELEGLIRDWGGKPEAAVLWSDLRVPAPAATWLNGVMAHARDYDDTHDIAILHAGVSVIPAALAAAEIAGRPVKGADFVAAVVVGLELMCRIGVATKIGIIEAGFIYSSLLGYFGATAAAGRLLGFTASEMVNAIGIAFSQAAGTHQVTRDAALTKRMQPGFAARAALTSVAMSRAGIRGAQRSIEGQDGLSRIYLRSAIDSGALREGLGERFHMQDLAYKPYPCCRFNHTAIDAALSLGRQPGFDWRKTTRIVAYTNSQAYSAVGTPLDIRRAPKTVVQAQFSICYTIACALVSGRVGLADFTQEALARPEILYVAGLVEPRIDDEIEARWSRSVGATRIVARCEGGDREARADHPRGGAENPMTAADFREKLIDCMGFGGFDQGGAGRIEGFVHDLRRSENVADAIRGLASLRS